MEYIIGNFLIKIVKEIKTLRNSWNSVGETMLERVTSEST
jgi:hypothetical protein